MNEKAQLPHEKLEAYGISKQFMTLAKSIDLPRLSLNEIHVARQLQYNAYDCFTKLVEGANRPEKRAKSYKDALESAMECCGLWEGCRVLDILDKTTFEEGQVLLDQLVPALRKLV